MDDEHGAVRASGTGRSGARDQRPRGITRRRELSRLGGLAAQRGGNQRADGRVPDRFHVRAAEPDLIQHQQTPRRVVHQLQLPGSIHDNHAFNHPRENRLRPCAIARQLL